LAEALAALRRRATALSGGLRDFTFHPDRRAAAANLVATVLAWNTPFYPLYLLWVVGTDAFPAGLLTLCSFPVWVAVPLLSRRHPLASRALLPLAGAANTVFCTAILGVASATELFLVPTTLLAAILFRRAERWVMLPLTCLPLVLYFALAGHYPVPAYSDAQNHAMLRLNAGSVGTFSIFLGFVAAGLIEES